MDTINFYANLHHDSWPLSGMSLYPTSWKSRMCIYDNNIERYLKSGFVCMKKRTDTCIQYLYVVIIDAHSCHLWSSNYLYVAVIDTYFVFYKVECNDDLKVKMYKAVPPIRIFPPPVHEDKRDWRFEIGKRRRRRVTGGSKRQLKNRGGKLIKSRRKWNIW